VARDDSELLGRDALLRAIRRQLRKRENVLLCGPADVGKTAVIQALAPREYVVLDPFEGVTPHLAARIRRAIYRGTPHLAAARSLDRGYLGAVRRIAFWFTVVSVPPLGGRWMARLLARECRRLGLPSEAMSPRWTDAVLRLARGRPGLAIAMVRAAAAVREAKGALPSPDVAFIEARIDAFRGGQRAAGF